MKQIETLGPIVRVWGSPPLQSYDNEASTKHSDSKIAFIYFPV